MWQAALLMPMLLTAPGGGTAESLAARIESVAAPQAEAGLLSGVLLVARDDEMLFHRAYGHASWELRVPNTPSTRFAVASIAKPMSRMLAHLLVEAGRLELDAPVDRYLQDFPRGPKGGRPTIAHLLAHRSGVPHRVTLASEEVEPLRPADIVRRVEQAGLLFEPGSRRLYSSAGFTCLARVIEIVEGKPFEEVLADQVFAPARMTSAISETGEVLMDRRALPHRLGAHGDRLVVKKGRHKDLRFLTGAGAVYATAGDLLRFVRAIRSGVFGPDHWKRELGADPRAWRGWTGRTGGYEASVDVLAAEDLIFVFLSNLRSAANWQIREQVKRVLTGGAAAAIPAPPAVARQSEQPASLLGTYGRAEITIRDGGLFRGENEFYPIDDARYYIPASGNTMRFRRDPAGRVDALISIGSDGREQVMPRTGDR